MLQNVHKSHAPCAPFQNFVTSNLLGYLRNFDANLCESEAIILVWAVLHGITFTARTL